MSFKPLWLVLILTLVSLMIDAKPACGQMFGDRSLGTPLNRQPNPGVGNGGGVGTLRNQRFIRGNRRKRDFVGIDRIDTINFTGLQQSGQGQAVRSAVTTAPVKPTLAASINQPLSLPSRTQMYSPKIEVDFNYAPAKNSLRARELTEHLISIAPTIEASVAGRKAILRGAVASEADAKLAIILASFQPGISVVENDLTIVDGREVPPPPRPIPATPSPPVNSDVP